MGIIRFGTRESRALARRSSLVPAIIAQATNERDSAMGGVVDVGGDFTRGLGQGVGIVIGLVSAGWIASKMLR